MIDMFFLRLTRCDIIKTETCFFIFLFFRVNNFSENSNDFPDTNPNIKS